MPDLFHRRVGAFGKLYAVGLGLGPRFSEVVRRTQVRSPVGTVGPPPKGDDDHWRVS